MDKWFPNKENLFNILLRRSVPICACAERQIFVSTVILFFTHKRTKWILWSSDVNPNNSQENITSSNMTNLSLSRAIFSLYVTTSWVRAGVSFLFCFSVTDVSVSTEKLKNQTKIESKCQKQEKGHWELCLLEGWFLGGSLVTQRCKDWTMRSHSMITWHSFQNTITTFFTIGPLSCTRVTSLCIMSLSPLTA